MGAGIAALAFSRSLGARRAGPGPPGRDERWPRKRRKVLDGVTILFGAKHTLRGEMASEAVLSMRNEERAVLEYAFTMHLLHFKWGDALIVRSFQWS